MAVAVVYYSATGNCALAAKALAGKLGASLVELREAKAKDLSRVNASFMLAGFRAAMGLRSKLAGQPWQDAAGADELHIVFPIWASKPVPAVNTFLSRMDVAGKRVALYTVQADPGDTAKPCREKLAEKIRAMGGTVIALHYLHGSAPGKEPKTELAQEVLQL